MQVRICQAFLRASSHLARPRIQLISKHQRDGLSGGCAVNYQALHAPPRQKNHESSRCHQNVDSKAMPAKRRSNSFFGHGAVCVHRWKHSESSKAFRQLIPNLEQNIRQTVVAYLQIRLQSICWVSLASILSESERIMEILQDYSDKLDVEHTLALDGIHTDRTRG